MHTRLQRRRTSAATRSTQSDAPQVGCGTVGVRAGGTKSIAGQRRAAGRGSQPACGDRHRAANAEAYHRPQLEHDVDGVCGWSYERTRVILRQWCNIRRGSSLFVKGLGGFDIMVALQKQSSFVTPDLFVTPDETWAQNEYWVGTGHRGWLGFTAELIRPANLQARGYFPTSRAVHAGFGGTQYNDDGDELHHDDADGHRRLCLTDEFWREYSCNTVVFDEVSFLLSQPETSGPRRHLIRYAGWWADNLSLMH